MFTACVKKISRDLLKVGEDDQTDDQGNDREAMSHHGQVVETEGKLWGHTKS